MAADQGGAVADVGDRRVDPLPFLLDQARGLFEVLGPSQGVLVGLDVFAQVDGDDVGALCRQHPRVGPTLAPRGTADDRYFAGYPAHFRPLARCLRARSALRPNVLRHGKGSGI